MHAFIDTLVTANAIGSFDGQPEVALEDDRPTESLQTSDAYSNVFMDALCGDIQW